MFDFELGADELAAPDALDTGVRGGPDPKILRAEALHAALTDCLSADGEEPPADDPFPTWHGYGVDDTCDHASSMLVARS
ncbi:hypothetical protein ACFWIO_01115 [Streptomyces diastatochromogenes]|uniref:hypothetical protein n=1 Tax=Streptomyces diastatochromogenes TaxID=42236 RepID=UPI0036696305